MRAMPAAQDVFDRVGGLVAFADPPATGGRNVYQGLRAITFLHEQPGFRPIGDVPGTYEGILDSITATIAELDHERSRLANEGPRPAFCRRGHGLGYTSDAPAFCPMCGSPAIAGCPACNAPIFVVNGTPRDFCASCGRALPWVGREGRIFQLENLLDQEGLDEATALAVREQLEALRNPDLDEEEERERWHRVKRLAPGLMESGRQILEGLVGAAIRHELGL